MRNSPIRPRYSFCAVLLSILVTVTSPLQAQQILLANQHTSNLPDAPSAVTRVSDARNDVCIFLTSSVLDSIPAGGQSAWRIGSFGENIPDHLALEQQALPYQSDMMVKLLQRDEHPILTSQVDWVTFKRSYSRLAPRAVHGLDDWQYYGHHIPVAGPLVLRVGQEAEAHPHIVSLFRVIQPQF